MSVAATMAGSGVFVALSAVGHDVAVLVGHGVLVSGWRVGQGVFVGHGVAVLVGHGVAVLVG